VANASHELRTPLAAERTLLQVALADPDATAQMLRSTCEQLLTLGHQQERLIEALLTLASSQRGVEQWERFDLVANLVDNALRHNVRGGQAEISTTTAAGRATILVRNTGAVIAPGDADRLFQPFRQLGNERIRHTGGHGLGLAIVHAIASAHGATLSPRARPEVASISR
jgi:signal transduction histidine kinase